MIYFNVKKKTFFFFCPAVAGFHTMHYKQADTENTLEKKFVVAHRDIWSINFSFNKQRAVRLTQVTVFLVWCNKKLHERVCDNDTGYMVHF